MKKQKAIFIMIFGMLVLAVFGVVFLNRGGFSWFGTSEKKTGNFMPGELLIRLENNISSSDLKALEQMTSRLGVQILNRFSIINAWYVKLPPNMTVQEAIQIYEQQPGVRYAEPNHIQYLIE